MSSLEARRAELDRALDERQATALIHNGVIFLNQRFPGWLQNVDLSTLDASQCGQCPLAQASGRNYTEAAQKLKMTDAQLSSYGFYRHSGPSYDQLTAAWKRMVRKLRNVA